MQLSNEELKEMAKRGLIAGPDETQESLLRRAPPPLPLSAEVKTFYDLFLMAPDWIEIEYSNKGLRFWEGGATWIGNGQVQIQLRSSFRKKELYLGIYSRQELVMHEFVHGIRQTFDEPIFEEILAYQTSTSSFRRYFGPLIAAPWESVLFILSLGLFALTFMFPLVQLLVGLWLFGLIGFGLVRLIKRQRIFGKALSLLVKYYGDKRRALCAMLFLRDEEIIALSRVTEIDQFMEKIFTQDLRGRQLALV